MTPRWVDRSSGRSDSIETLSRDTVRRYYKRWYRPEHIVVAAAGNLDHAAVVRLVKRAFAVGGVALDRRGARRDAAVRRVPAAADAGRWR